MKNREIISHLSDLNQFSNRGNLPINFSYVFSKNLQILANEKDVIIDAHEYLLDKYAQKDEQGERVYNENGTNVLIKEEFRDFYKEESDKLLDEESDIKIKKIKLSSIKDIDISIEDMLLIEFMIEDDVNE